MKNMVREADVAQAFQTGWQLYKENFGFILGATLVALLVGVLSCGICAAPMLCGLYGILLALLRRRNPKPRFDELFNEGFARFAPAFVATLVLGIASAAASGVSNFVPILGALVGWAVSLIGSGMISWAQLLVIDQNATIGEAINAPFQNLQNRYFWSFVLVAVLAGLAAGGGLLLCGIGVFFTMPYGICVTVAAYEQVIGGTGFVPGPVYTSAPPR